MDINNNQVEILTEAIPYLREFKDKTIVVKYGGNAMLNDELKNKVLQDIVFLQSAGMRPVVVHGGGPEITRMLVQAGKKSTFVSGLRVTDAESVGIAEMALVGKINTDLVARLNTLGGQAVGLNGKDGVTDIYTHEGPAGVDGKDGEDGITRIVYIDPKDPSTLISELTVTEAKDLLETGYIQGGMLPKLTNCTEAIRGGVNRVHILDGRVPHSLLMEIFTKSGFGTMIFRDGDMIH